MLFDMSGCMLLTRPIAAETSNCEDKTMTSKFRSLSGAALMLVIIPIFAGLLACMPVTIGNPERSRIDPELSGLWVIRVPDEEWALFMLEPYDKRTWLGIMVEPEAPEGAAPGEYEVDELALYKVWLTKLRGEEFMVWEPRGAYEKGKFGAGYGLNWKITRHNESRFDLNMINFDHAAFEDVDDQNRKALERVIRRHISDPELYYEDTWTFTKVDEGDPDSLGDLFSALLDNF